MLILECIFVEEIVVVGREIFEVSGVGGFMMQVVVICVGVCVFLFYKCLCDWDVLVVVVVVVIIDVFIVCFEVVGDDLEVIVYVYCDFVCDYLEGFWIMFMSVVLYDVLECLVVLLICVVVVQVGEDDVFDVVWFVIVWVIGFLQMEFFGVFCFGGDVDCVFEYGFCCFMVFLVVQVCVLQVGLV